MLLNKKVLVDEMVAAHGPTVRTAEVSVFQALLNKLADREVRMLRSETDLIERVRQIANYDTSGLLKVLKNDFSLGIEHVAIDCSGTEVFIDIEKLIDIIPDWVDNEHCGWAFNLGRIQFPVWARQFLMQEVQINLWIRFFENRKRVLATTRGTAPGYM